MHSPELYTQAVVTRAGEVALSDASRPTVNAPRPVAGAKVTLAACTAAGLVADFQDRITHTGVSRETASGAEGAVVVSSLIVTAIGWLAAPETVSVGNVSKVRLSLPQ